MNVPNLLGDMADAADRISDDSLGKLLRVALGVYRVEDITDPALAMAAVGVAGEASRMRAHSDHMAELGQRGGKRSGASRREAALHDDEAERSDASKHRNGDEAPTDRPTDHPSDSPRSPPAGGAGDSSSLVSGSGGLSTAGRGSLALFRETILDPLTPLAPAIAAQFGRGAWKHYIAEIGEERVREEVERFAAEIDAGEEVLNRPAALTARLKRLAGED